MKSMARFAPEPFVSDAQKTLDALSYLTRFVWFPRRIGLRSSMGLESFQYMECCYPGFEATLRDDTVQS